MIVETPLPTGEGLVLKLYTCTDHDYHYPVGVASVVLAYGEEDARQWLDKKLVAAGLSPYAKSPYTLAEVSLHEPVAVVLCDGNY